MKIKNKDYTEYNEGMSLGFEINVNLIKENSDYVFDLFKLNESDQKEIMESLDCLDIINGIIETIEYDDKYKKKQEFQFLWNHPYNDKIYLSLIPKSFENIDPTIGFFKFNEVQKITAVRDKIKPDEEIVTLIGVKV